MWDILVFLSSWQQKFPNLIQKICTCQFACQCLNKERSAYTKEAFYIFELNQIETLLIEKYETGNCRTSGEENTVK